MTEQERDLLRQEAEYRAKHDEVFSRISETVIELLDELDAAEREMDRVRKMMNGRKVNPFEHESLKEENHRLQQLDATNQETITTLADQLEKERNRYKELFYDHQSLRKALEEIIQENSPVTKTVNPSYVLKIARQALEKEGLND